MGKGVMAMKSIHIFTEKHQDILAQRLLEDAAYSFDGLIAGLTDVAAQIMGKDEKHELESKFRDFLSENEYIHFDAFISICLEDVHA